ncbi:hypothetical protein M8C21_025610, partial [Ambrosia artemisiifolia]
GFKKLGFNKQSCHDDVSDYNKILFRVVCNLSTIASEPQRVKTESCVKSEDIKKFTSIGSITKTTKLIISQFGHFYKGKQRLFFLESWTADVVVSDSIKLWMLRAILIEVYACGGQELVQRWLALFGLDLDFYNYEKARHSHCAE